VTVGSHAGGAPRRGRLGLTCGALLLTVWPQQFPAGIVPPQQPPALFVIPPHEHPPLAQVPQLHWPDPVSGVTPRDGVSW
jgi:hypothetical protein